MEENYKLIHFQKPSEALPQKNEYVLCIVGLLGVYEYVIALFTGERFMMDDKFISPWVIEWASLWSLDRFKNKV